MVKHMVMAIDLQLCSGCNTCTIACKQENNLPDGVCWTNVITIGPGGEDSPRGEYPHLRLDYLPLGCQHCTVAPCIEVCPTSATFRLPDTGIVMLDTSLCVGCRYCMQVCPFTGVRVFSESLHYPLPYAVGDNPIVHREKTVEKCTFCAHRLAEGLPPACVDACPLAARTFGDLNDPESEVCELLRSRPHFQLLADKGTQASVYYLT